MHILQSLRFRIVLMCCVLALITNLLFGYVLTFSLKINDDELFIWHLNQHMTQLISLYHENKDAFDSHLKNSNEKLLIGTEKQALAHLASQMTAPFARKEIAAAASLNEIDLEGPVPFISEEGYENYELGSENESYHILKAPLDKEHLYYFVDVSDFNRYSTNSVQKTLTLFSVSILLIMGCAVVAGIFLSRRVVSPLKRLTKEVDLQATGQKSNLNKNTFYQDEVGFLAHRIDHFLNRINEFIEREKAFTRDASHELRTPVANSQAALEVIEELLQTKDYSKIKTTLGRIERSNKDMAQLIESFLLLGREECNFDNQKPCALVPICHEAFEKNRFLKASDNVSIKINIDDQAAVTAPIEYLSVVIHNLIRNALQHRTGNTIYISGDSHKIEISNETVATTNNDQIGIGLKIVERICERLNWSMDIDTTEDNMFRISILFLNKDKSLKP
ncbi:sensor histidine kinase [Curvivirga sp.]|uniref:sensor histidine kinase n=1 Tax=Curvivirga sp. TaxID=2856848 RepID=UPI003B5B0755